MTRVTVTHDEVLLTPPQWFLYRRDQNLTCTFQCYWTYKNGQFVHPQTQEVMVNKEILLLGTNDVNFVNRFLGLFHEMGKYKANPFSDQSPTLKSRTTWFWRKRNLSIDLYFNV